MNRKLAIQILEELIQIDTTNPPGNEKKAAEYLQSLFRSHHILAEIQDLGGGRANLVASYGGEGPEVILCGHLDVVPANGDWTHPPFQMTGDGGRLYGRGTADMKGAVAAMSAVLITLAQHAVPMCGKVTLALVADEECSNLGMIRFLKDQRDVRLAVIGEPTDLQVAVAHRGVLRDYIDVTAPPYHAALPERKNNAMQSAAEVMLAIFQLNETLRTYRHEILPAPSIAVTMVEGYENDNIVPGHVRLLTDFRILPGMTFEECRKLEEDAIAGIGEQRITKHFFMSGGETDWHSVEVKRCCEIGASLLHRQQEPVAFDASCEQCFLVSRGIPTVICGPGSLKQAHSIDEYVEMEQIELAEQYYLDIVKAFLIGDENHV